jgi:DNA-binding NarL/FixJ family response regulator
MGEKPESLDRLQIVIADDHTLFREGLVSILDAQSDIQVVGQCGTAEEAVRLAHDLLPEIILLDLNMPGDGLKAAQRIAAELPVIKIAVLTASEEDEHLVAALQAGARAFILKGVAGRELLRILRKVTQGESYVPPALAAGLLREMHVPGREDQEPDKRIEELTEREFQILEGLASGLSNKEIGKDLFLSEKTVKHYVTNILQKLQVRNRVEAALLAQRSGKLGDSH